MARTRAANATPKRGPCKKPRLSENQVAMKNSLLDVAARQVNEESKKAGGSMSRGFLDALLKDIQSNGVLADATRDTLCNHKKKLDRQKDKSPGLFAPTMQPPPNNNDSDEASRVTPSPPPVNKGGRPSGTSNESKLLRKQACDMAMESATKACVDKVAEAGNEKSPAGALENICKEAQTKFRVHLTTALIPGTTRSRARRGNPRGRMKTPVEHHEPHLVALCIESNEANQPLNEQRFLEIANSLIKGTDTEKTIMEMKKNSKAPDTESGNVLGARCFQNFVKRHQLVLESAKAHSQDMHRQNWSVCGNFKFMCEHICGQLVEMGIAKKRDTPLFVDREGSVVDTEEESFGMPVECDLLHPELFLHLDETGCNTNMKKDGQAGGRRFISARGCKCSIAGANTDMRFAVLPVSNSLGDPVLCVLICQSKDGILPDNMMTGTDLHVTPQGATEDDDFIALNSGPGKCLPGGPICAVNGINVPCCVSCSKHGGITGEMLADIFRCLDKLAVCPRGEGVPNPCLLLDGHGSRFDPEFFEHIMNDDHRWGAFVGVPFGAALWQVGDATQCNGSFKIALTKAKQELIELRKKLGLPVKFKTSDVIPLLNKAWADSFGGASKTKKALADRGWNPLNMALLKNPDVTATIDATDKQNLPIQMNVDEGKVAELLDDLNFRQDKQKARRRGAERKRAAQAASSNLDRAEKLTAGKMVRNGKHRLDDDGLASIRRCTQAKKEEAAAKEQRATNVTDKLFDDVAAVRAKGSPSKWTQKDCGTMNKCKKNGRDDTALAKTLPGLKEQWDERKDRPSPVKPTRQPMPLLPGQSDLQAAALDLDLANSTSTEEAAADGDGRPI